MLSVGRELFIKDKGVACQNCGWEGLGAQLSTGLTEINHGNLYFCVYRCPACGGADVSRRGKLLQFRRLPSLAGAGEEAPLLETDLPARKRI